jgi:hypothetical protein
LVNCPNCGTAVASNQRFCGNCGTDVQAALAARGAPVADAQQSPYAYAQPTYNYDAGYNEPARGRNRLILVLAVLVIVACCAFACGLLLGFELIPDLLGLTGGAATPRPTPRVTPTPQSMWMLFNYLIG